ncbi:MAG: hypothetical protein CL815_04710 [Coraliomargarita sp.]|nr:hypothetical protein [Coraliomargarita sp.]
MNGSRAYSGFYKFLEYCFARCALCFLRILPVKAAYFLGEKIGLICWMLMSGRRATVKENLRIVQRWIDLEEQPSILPGIANGKTIDTATKEVFCRSAANLLSSFSFAALSFKKRHQLVEFENLEVLKDAVDRGHGVVLLMAHMGPWEIVSSFAGHFTYNGVKAPLGAIYRTLNNDYMEKWYLGQRERQGMQLFKRKAGLLEVFKFMKSGGILALLADQRVNTGENTEFFGEPALTTPLVGVLAKRAKASVVSLTLKYDRSCKLRAAFHLVDFEEAKTREDFAKLTNQELEKVLTSDTTSGFWFHKRFKM